MLLPTEIKVQIIGQINAEDMINYLCASKDSYSIIQQSLKSEWASKLKGVILDKLLIKTNYSAETFYHLLLSGQIEYAKSYNKHLVLMFWNLSQFTGDQVCELAVKLIKCSEFKLLDRIINYKFIKYWRDISPKVFSRGNDFTFDQCVYLLSSIKYNNVMPEYCKNLTRIAFSKCCSRAQYLQIGWFDNFSKREPDNFNF